MNWVQAENIYENAARYGGVSFSPDGKGWTTNAGVKNGEIADCEKDVVYIGRKSSLHALEEWQHLYSYKRVGEIPVGKWQPVMSRGYCEHLLGTNYPSAYLGLEFKLTDTVCHGYYLPAWQAYCADCEEPVYAAGVFKKGINMYATKETIASITSIPTGKYYYYLCPHCAHLEQGVEIDGHTCKAISTNRYRVVYLLSDEDKMDGASDNIRTLPSIHMYNNESVYEGQAVTPQTTLNPCSFTYTGHVFKCWALTTKNEDGSFTVDYETTFEDRAEIYNLTTENWQDDTSTKGTVYLTAVWEVSGSTLQIDPNGGNYQNERGKTIITQGYGSIYTIDVDDLTAPKGFKVTFSLNGGRLESNGSASLESQKNFAGFQKSKNFQGDWDRRNYIYCFKTPDGNVDTLTAQWENGSILLPEATKAGYAFGGWYLDAAGKNFAGFAGDSFTPAKNLTLYAIWVDLRLTGTDNYLANEGRGAVDLSWYWGDAAQGANKTYLIYQKQGENGDWVQIDKTSLTAEPLSAEERFVYHGEGTQTYTIPYTGIYTLTAAGAQGEACPATTEKSDVKTNPGGGGGVTTVRVWLEEGDVLTYACGGSDGGNGGGIGECYGNGGGYTIISSARKGVLVLAGGGGGATPLQEGGAGGSTLETERNISEYSGQNGQAGGGGGSPAGAAGSYEIHTHDEDCTLTEPLDYSLFKSGWWQEYTQSAVIPSTWYGRYNYLPGTITSDARNVHTENFYYYGITAHGKGSPQNPAMVHLGIGAVYGDNQTYVYPSFSEGYLPVAGNTSVSFDFVFLSNADDPFYGSKPQFSQKEENGIRIYNQDNKLIYEKTLAEFPYTYEEEPSNELLYRVQDTLVLPEGTTSIYFECHMEEGVNNSWYLNNGKGLNIWLYLYANSIIFHGGIRETYTCGYTEGQILVREQAQGGGSYVNTVAVLSYENTPGGNTGNGYVEILGEALGFVSECALSEVAAPDVAAPGKLQEEDLQTKALSKTRIQLAWPDITTLTEKYENYTNYSHLVKAYPMGCNLTEDTLPVESNEVTNALGGIRGVYVSVDEQPDTRLTKGNLWTETTMEVTLTTTQQYFHIALVDIGGNVGETAHFQLDKLPVYWLPETQPLTLSGGDGIYQKEESTYYVRADGSVSLLLHYQAQLQGAAREDYQINYAILELEESGGDNRYIGGKDITIVKNSPLQESYLIPERDISRTQEGSSSLYANQYTVVVRSSGDSAWSAEDIAQSPSDSDAATEDAVQSAQDFARNTFSMNGLSMDKRFVLQSGSDGKVITLCPRAGAYIGDGLAEEADISAQEDILYSDSAADRENSLCLIGDGAAPELGGMEKLRQSTLEDIQEDGCFRVTLTARDTGSGVKAFYAILTNRDSGISRVIESANKSDLIIELSEEDELLMGDTELLVCAEDNVGNVTEESSNLRGFTLEVTVERILSPHAPVFKAGESGKLLIKTSGYVERIEVEYPKEWAELGNYDRVVYTYGENAAYYKEESLEFMVPLKIWSVTDRAQARQGSTESKEYVFTVRAFKKGSELQAEPELAVLRVNGSVLDEIRVRLR